MAQPAEGVIHDIGYQRYDGPRLGRPYAIRALYTHSLRAAFGLGRGAAAKIVPFSLVGVCAMVAVILTVNRSLSGQVALHYVDVTQALSLVLVVYLAVAGPDLVSRDLRGNLLSLYFSRPIERSDYALAKLAAFISAVIILLSIPQLIMFFGAAFSTDNGLRGVWDEFVDLLPGLATAAIHALVLCALSLLLASLAPRRVFATGAIVAVFLVTTPVSGVLYAVGSTDIQQLAEIVHPIGLLAGVQEWLFGGDASAEIGRFGPVYGLAALAMFTLTSALLVYRYRRVAA